MDISYIITPFVAWFIAGTLKFAINSLKARNAAFKQIGYGGFPSNHTTIVTSIACLIGMKEGVESPALGVAIALSFIVILDATSLRIKVGDHARRINLLVPHEKPLREVVGHKPIEILGGILTGLLTASIIHNSASWLTLN